MTNQILLMICASLIFFIGIYVFRKSIVMWLLKVRSKLSLHSLREAIHAADANKEQTGRKNIVVYNSTNREFEPIQKKQLKTVANRLKNKNNAAQTPGRKRVAKKGVTRLIDSNRIKETEKKSLYVTK